MGQKFRDEAGNIWEMGPDGQPRLVSAGQSPAMGPAIGNDPRLPLQMQGNQLQNTRTAQEIAKNPLDIASAQQGIAASQNNIRQSQIGNVQELRKEFNALPEVKNYAEYLNQMSKALRAPKNPQGDLSVIYAFAKAMDPGSVVREGEMDMANSTASVVAQFRQKYKSFRQGKGLPPEVRAGLIESIRSAGQGFKDAYDQQYVSYGDRARALGANPIAVVGNHRGDAFRGLEEQYLKSVTGKDTANAIDNAPVRPEFEAATGPTRQKYDPETSAGLDTLIRRGRPYAEASAYLRGRDPTFAQIDPKTYAAAVAHAKAHPNYQGSYAEANRTVPTSYGERLSGSTAPALVNGIARGLTLGFNDEIVGGAKSLLTDQPYTEARDEFNAQQEINANANGLNRGANLFGQAVGGAATGLGITNALGKLPGMSGSLLRSGALPNVLSRQGLAGDAAYSAGYGSGVDNQDRLGGAVQGLEYGVPGGMAARGATSGLASAISPTGGDMRVLYDMGVRPSIGQRFGGVLNSAEEKLQSIPLAGDFIAGTRQRARDQFQVGLFNDSLGEIGQSLPRGIKPGNEPHAFAQKAFSDAYSNAEQRMIAAADADFGTDIGNLQRTVSTLTGDSQNRFNKIWQDSVARRFTNGQLSGPAYKDAMSELSQRVRDIRSSKTGDGELANALEEAQGAIRGAATRNSPPEAVQALDAADKGYAKLVRIEDAARRRGGDAGTFSPSQYDAAVQATSGGKRSRGYLSGDALNSDIAKAGLRLRDEVPNSASWDRAAWAGGVGGLAYLEPQSLIGFGALGAMNAPGIRNFVTGAMAPRELVQVGPASIDLGGAAKQLRRRAPYVGMFGAPLSVDLYAQ